MSRPIVLEAIVGSLRLTVVAVAAAGLTLVGTASASTPPASSVVNQLRAAGVPITKVRVYTETNDGNHLLGRPGQYTSKANFGVKGVPASKDFAVSGGGAVEVFGSRGDAKRRYEYLSVIAKSSPLFSEYDYLEGKVVMRLSSVITPTVAKRYEKVFRKVV